jgi:hypothetical protein
MPRFALMGFALVLVGSAAMAQGTPQQRAACEQDANRFCVDVMPDENMVRRCLARHRSKLSPACRRAFTGKRSRGR